MFLVHVHVLVLVLVLDVLHLVSCHFFFWWRLDGWINGLYRWGFKLVVGQTVRRFFIHWFQKNRQQHQIMLLIQCYEAKLFVKSQCSYKSKLLTLSWWCWLELLLYVQGTVACTQYLFFFFFVICQSSFALLFLSTWIDKFYCIALKILICKIYDFSLCHSRNMLTFGNDD